MTSEPRQMRVTEPHEVLNYADRLGLFASPPYSLESKRRAYKSGYEDAVRDLVNGRIVGYGVVVTWR